MVDNMKAIVIGSSVLETTCQIKNEFKEGDTIRLDNRIESGGGTACNIAYVLGKWGIETYIASMLGADDYATKIKKELEEVGVKIDYIETSYDKSTGHSLVIVNSITKQNTAFHVLSNAFLKKYTFAVEPDIIVTDGNDFNATMSALDRYTKAQSYFVVRNITQETLGLCQIAKFLIFNQNTAEAVSNIKINFNDSGTIVNAFNKLKQKFNNAEIVITLGEKGSVYSINGNVKIMPPIKMEVVDTNGAGDIFAGVLIYCMANNFGLEMAICYATIASSMSVAKLSVHSAVPSLSEVSNYYDGKFGAQNNPNNVNANIETLDVNTPNSNVEQLEATNMDTGVPTPPPSNPSIPQENVPPVPPTNPVPPVNPGVPQ